MKIVASRKIVSFLGCRVKNISSKIKGVKFQVVDRDPRGIEIWDEYKNIKISAKGISNLNSDFNKIGLLQAYYRFMGINSMDCGVFILHASAAIIGNSIIIFGDNGKSIGKTLSSLELGLSSKEYIADEFIFWNSKNNRLEYDFSTPIHIRDEVKKHLKLVHKINITKDFISPNELKFNKSHQRPIPDIICYVNFVTNKFKPRIVSLKMRKSVEYARKTFTAHIEKLIYPELDRFQFISKKDLPTFLNKKRKIKLPKLIQNKINKGALSFASAVKSYELFINNPCQITNLILDAQKNVE